jgi:DNA replication protein DnaC
LYKVIDRRNRRGSTALVTNVDFKFWTEYLRDPPLAMAILDRVVDTAIIKTFEGKSYRDHRSQQKRANGQENKAKSRRPEERSK